MSVFSTKLDSLRETLRLALSADASALSTALSSGIDQLSIAVGSGGSAIAAEYLRVCRRTLGSSPTLVQTPMEFVLGTEALSDAHVYLFSAGGRNPDILAAFDAASIRGAGSVNVITNTDTSELAQRCSASDRFNLHVLPVADPKDGYLATHSLMSAVTVLLNASHRILNHMANGSIGERYLLEANAILSKDSRALLAQGVSSLRPNDTLLLLHDPRLTSVGLLIETSVWEAALCSIQRTDYRNFAHGRHVWLAKRPAETILMSLTGFESRAIWEDLDRLVPSGVRRVSFDRGNCGRFQTALGILHALTIVEALGFATGVDPGKPGVGSFARDIYESPFLKELSDGLSAAVRHKYAKHIAHDDPSSGDVDLTQSFAAFKARLGSANFAGVVLDYDGTIVTTEGRFQPPSTEMVTALSRLLEDGIPTAIATGRGGSAGEDLREVIPKTHHPKFLIGYYNGAYIRPLSVDIRNEPPPTHSVITDVETWLARNADLFKEYVIKNSHVQVTIDFSKLHNVDEFERRFRSDFSAVARVRVSRSGHTIDICPVETCKTAVVKALADLAGASVESILCIGDRGGHFGNDHVMLGTLNGISVDDVCHRPDVCWSLFGATMTGPRALVHILRSLRRGSDGRIRLNVEELSNART